MNTIEHEGTVIGIVEPNKLSVKIVQLSACVSCKAAKICSAAESKEKIIEAYSNDTTLTIGDEVIVYGQASLGHKALVLAIVVPLCILLAALIIATKLTGNEVWGGVIGIAALVPYYAMLALMKDRLQRVFVFNAKRK